MKRNDKESKALLEMKKLTKKERKEVLRFSYDNLAKLLSKKEISYTDYINKVGILKILEDKLETWDKEMIHKNFSRLL